MNDLKQLEGCAPIRKDATQLGGVSTPLILSAWSEELRPHPDREFAGYLVNGINQGFRIGSKGGQLQSAVDNMRSVATCPQVVDEYISKECGRGTMLGPLPSSMLAELDVHINRFGIIPKSGRPGQWRLIVDLSYPEFKSVNDGIDKDLCSLSYATVDAIRAILQLGRDSLLAKLDLESAYRMLPVHPEDRPLLGMKWKGQVYVDKALPFGLRSAPKIFSAMADGLMWIMGNHGVEWGLHYLDDYLFVGRPDSRDCSKALSTALGLCKTIGVRVST